MAQRSKRARMQNGEVPGNGNGTAAAAELLLPLEAHLEGQVHRVEPTGEEKFVP